MNNYLRELIVGRGTKTRPQFQKKNSSGKERKKISKQTEYHF